MEQDEHDLEEGEIEEDDELTNIYTPLQRPETYSLDAPAKRFQEVGTAYSDSEEEIQSSESDSDSDSGPRTCKKPKKRKVILKPLQQRPSLHKKYDIWSTRASEDVLASTMVSCDVTKKDRSYGVESYDVSVVSKYYENLENQQGNKRRRDDMKNNYFKQKKRLNLNNPEEKEVKGKIRELPELCVNGSSSIEDIVKDIASKLSEEREDLILKVVEVMGKEKAIDFYNETREIESEGGMLIMNQTRQRTSGGVFLYLVKHDYHITREQENKIFSEDKQNFNKKVKEQKKKKLKKLKINTNLERNILLPDLLTRAEIFSKENSQKKRN